MTVTTIVLSIDPLSVPADGVTKATAIAIVKDETDAVVAGATVSWTISDANAGLSSTSSVTDIDGSATVDISSSTVNPVVTLKGTADAVNSNDVTVAFTQVVDDSSIKDISIVPMCAKSGESEVISVLVVDAQALPKAGVTVNWSSEITGVLSDESSVTDDKGIAQVTVTSDISFIGAFLIEATVGAANVVITARFSDPTIPPVFVPNGMDGELDQYDLKGGVQAIIDEYAHATVGDTLIFYWDAVHHYTKQITNIATDFPITIDVTNNFPPACLTNGTYSVFYEYIDSSRNVNISRSLNLTVSGGELPATLPEPTFTEGRDGWINYNEATRDGGTPIAIIYPNMAIGDSLHVTWRGYDESGIIIPASVFETDYTVLDTDLTDGCSVVVPTDSIMPIVVGTAQADYLLTPVDGSDKQQSVYAAVQVDVQK